MPIDRPAPNNVVPAVMPPATLRADVLVLAMATLVLAVNVTLALPVSAPTVITVLEPAKPPVPMLMVLTLPDDVAPEARLAV